MSENPRQRKEHGGEFIRMRELLTVPSICLAFKQGWSVLTHSYISANSLHSTQRWSCWRNSKRKEVDHLVTKHPVCHFPLPGLCSHYQKGFPVWWPQFKFLSWWWLFFVFAFVFLLHGKRSFVLQVLIVLTRIPVLLICNSGCAKWGKIYKDL